MRAFVRRVSLLPFARSVSFLPQNFVSNRRRGHWPSAFCRGYGAWKPSPDGGWLSTFHRHCEISAHTGVVTEGNACGAIRSPPPLSGRTPHPTRRWRATFSLRRRLWRAHSNVLIFHHRRSRHHNCPLSIVNCPLSCPRFTHTQLINIHSYAFFIRTGRTM